MFNNVKDYFAERANPPVSFPRTHTNRFIRYDVEDYFQIRENLALMILNVEQCQCKQFK